jgi:methylmalonyl-CoA/ethylmalonyl-CoA epimerase
MDLVEHIGIAVRSLAASGDLYRKLLGTESYRSERVESEGVETLFFRMGSTKIELLEAVSPDSPIARFIEKRGEGIHHIAFAVKDIRQEMLRLKNGGVRLLNEEPKRGADNKWVCFVHPEDTSGVLIELCEEIRN